MKKKFNTKTAIDDDTQFIARQVFLESIKEWDRIKQNGKLILDNIPLKKDIDGIIKDDDGQFIHPLAESSEFLSIMLGHLIESSFGEGSTVTIIGEDVIINKALKTMVTPSNSIQFQEKYLIDSIERNGGQKIECDTQILYDIVINEYTRLHFVFRDNNFIFVSLISKNEGKIIVAQLLKSTYALAIYHIGGSYPKILDRMIVKWMIHWSDLLKYGETFYESELF